MDSAVNVEIVFSEVARHALEPDTAGAEPRLPAGFVARAHLAVPGDPLQLPDSLDLFVVTQRIWSMKGGRPTLRLLLDVLVQDQD